MKSKFVATLALAGTLMAMALAGCQSKPEKPSAAGSAAPATRMTADRAHQVGREISEILVSKEKLLDSDKVSLYANRVGQYAAFHLDTGPKNMKCVGGGEKVLPPNGFRFALVHSPEKETVALPGGFIYISDALLAELTSEDQLAGIFAHEATNVVCQHGMARMQKVADTVPVGKQAPRYERLWKSTLPVRFKMVADRGAMMALYNGGYSPAAYIELVEKMGGPDSADRVAAMKKDFAKMQSKGLVDTSKSRAARFADFKRMSGV